MKKYFLFLVVLIVLVTFNSSAQHIKMRLNFPVGVSLHANAPAPFAGAVWIGPEWKWNGREYVHVAGYWSKPNRRRHWIPGHWKYSRRGYFWMPGHWK